ncbi:COG0694 Thioredoxin-like proteins and domains [Acidimicrobiia bacterium]
MGESLARLCRETDCRTSDRGTSDSSTYTGSVRAQVEQVIEVIRPAIQADNGDVVLHDVNEETGLVTVELIGACVSCPASTVTLKAGLERILMDRVPGVTEVIDAGAAKAEIGETPVSL